MSRCSYDFEVHATGRRSTTMRVQARLEFSLRGYRPQLGNPAKHRHAQSRLIPARQRANALRVLRPTALLAPCRIPTPPRGHAQAAVTAAPSVVSESALTMISVCPLLVVPSQALMVPPSYRRTVTANYPRNLRRMCSLLSSLRLIETIQCGDGQQLFVHRASHPAWHLTSGIASPRAVLSLT
jgi:hypothetical protein